MYNYNLNIDLAKEQNALPQSPFQRIKQDVNQLCSRAKLERSYASTMRRHAHDFQERGHRRETAPSRPDPCHAGIRAIGDARWCSGFLLCYR